jgi:hypothetical protein
MQVYGTALTMVPRIMATAVTTCSVAPALELLLLPLLLPLLLELMVLVLLEVLGMPTPALNKWLHTLARIHTRRLTTLVPRKGRWLLAG